MEKNYVISNNETEISIYNLSKLEYLKIFKSGELKSDRQYACQIFCNYLCGCLNIPYVKVLVLDKPQPSTKYSNGKLKSKVMGKYIPSKHTIVLYNLTSSKKQVVSIKGFADTLLHEFMHHYDITYLRLNATLHTEGFHKRIYDLKKKLT